MRDSGLIIRQKIYDRLNNGGITYKNETVHIYDSASVPANASTPYIVLGTFTSTEQGEGSKQSYGQECFINVEVITTFANAYGGKLMCDEITDEVMQLLRTRQNGYLDLSPYWSLISITLDNSLTLETLLSDGMEVRRINRFKLNIYEQ
jgi:hypothetical protein